MLNQIGEIMAKLHKISPPVFIPTTYAFGLESYKKFLKNNLKSKNNRLDSNFVKWLTEKEYYLKKMISNELPRGLIHADIFWDNVLFNNKKLQAIIDFEESCNYYLAFDIAMSFDGSCQSKGIISLEKSKAILNGYQKVRKLTKVERDMLKDLTEYAAVSTSFIRYVLKEVGISKEKLRDYREMIHIADTIHAISHEKFNAKLDLTK
jgi:homoserine kinase type II